MVYIPAENTYHISQCDDIISHVTMSKNGGFDHCENISWEAVNVCSGMGILKWRRR